MTSIARNQWYVAAYGREIGRELFSRTICGESILFWRTEAGEVTADDRPLRAPPVPAVAAAEPPGRRQRRLRLPRLHLRRRRHLRRRARPDPGPAHRAAARVPGRRAGHFVWVWIGDPRPAPTPPASRGRRGSTRPGCTTVCGMEPLAARYGLLVDNLLDLSHETYLHGGYIGTPEVASTPITTEVDEEAGIVYVSRHMDDAECPPFYAKSHRPRRAASRAGRTSSTPRRACTCCTAGSRRSASLPNAGRHRPRRVPRRGRLRDHPGDREHAPTTSGPSPATSRSTTRRSRDFLRESNRTVVLQDVVALERARDR